MIGTLETAPFPPAIANAVSQAVNSTLSSICGAGFSALPTETELESPSSGIVAVISFAGDRAWSFSLFLPESTASYVAKCFAGFDISFESPDMGDLVGELVNVIAGDITALLDRAGIRAQMSLPTVIRGRDVDMPFIHGLSSLRLGFAGREGSMWFKLAAGKPAQSMAKKPLA